MFLDFFFLFISPCGLHFWDFSFSVSCLSVFFKLIFLYFRNSLKGFYFVILHSFHSSSALPTIPNSTFNIPNLHWYIYVFFIAPGLHIRIESTSTLWLCIGYCRHVILANSICIYLQIQLQGHVSHLKGEIQ